MDFQYWTDHDHATQQDQFSSFSLFYPNLALASVVVACLDWSLCIFLDHAMDLGFHKHKGYVIFSTKNDHVVLLVKLKHKKNHQSCNCSIFPWQHHTEKSSWCKQKQMEHKYVKKNFILQLHSFDEEKKNSIRWNMLNKPQKCAS